jgi:hypothetical protein
MPVMNDLFTGGTGPGMQKGQGGLGSAMTGYRNPMQDVVKPMPPGSTGQPSGQSGFMPNLQQLTQQLQSQMQNRGQSGSQSLPTMAPPPPLSGTPTLGPQGLGSTPQPRFDMQTLQQLVQQLQAQMQNRGQGGGGPTAMGGGWNVGYGTGPQYQNPWGALG